MTSTSIWQQMPAQAVDPLRAAGERTREGARMKRRFGERFPHCTNTGGCCEDFEDWSACDRCGFCVMEQLRREKLKLSRGEDGLMRMIIKKKSAGIQQSVDSRGRGQEAADG